VRPAQSVPKDRKDRLGLRERRVRPVRLDHKDHKGCKVRRDSWVLPDCRVHRVPLEHKGLPERPACKHVDRG